MNTITISKKKYGALRGEQQHSVVLAHIKKTERALLKLKRDATPGAKKIVISLGGVLKGIAITEEDIKQAKRSLFGH